MGQLLRQQYLALLLLSLVSQLFCIASSTDTHVYPTNAHNDTKHGCTPLRVSQCTSLGYSNTRVPNTIANLRSQEDAQHILNSFAPLLQYGCSPNLRILLCGYYAPMCSALIDSGLAVPPCRSLCVSVRRHCAPIMAMFSYPWPLQCDLLPFSNSPGSLCMEGPAPKKSSKPETLDVGRSGSSAAECGVVRYTSQDREFATVWLAIWSVVCCGVTLFCLLSFLMWVK